ncbi:MAG: hypothetical protein C4325_07845, partial [Blastocatellia bacterium]
EAKVRELRKKVRVPGFRPGKAPRRMLESHLGRDYIYMEALQDRLPSKFNRPPDKSRWPQKKFHNRQDKLSNLLKTDCRLSNCRTRQR